jgi:hypothetical protein
MIEPRTLNDGTPIRYALGLAHHKDRGVEMIQHGGGINGFLSESRYYPQEDLYVVCLVNTTGPMNPDTFADLLTWKVIDPTESAGMEIEPELSGFSGSYAGQVRGQKMMVELTISQEGLVIQPEGGEPDTVRTYIGNNTFLDGNDVITFTDNEVNIDQVYGYYTFVKQ